jgi:arylsulfatase A-like enzyme
MQTSTIRLLTSGALAFALLAAPLAAAPPPPAPAPHNVILFVPDGLRASMVDATTAPTMNAIKQHGVSFANSHSLFPTFTTANASGFATGHYLGDTGDFSNTIYAGFPVVADGRSVTPFLENDPILTEMSNHFGGTYLDEETILAAARAAGYSTAAIGKLGPAAIFDTGDPAPGTDTIVIDDATGHANAAGVSQAWPLPPAVDAQLVALLGKDVVPPRGANGDSGTATRPGTTVANLVQQGYFVDAATKVVLPLLKAKGKPFVLVFWSRDPDGTQHNQGDSLGSLTPGINGPTSLAAIKNADDDLGQLRAALRTLGLEATTDIIVSADHGFSTISKQSQSSAAAAFTYPDVPAKQLPPGFLAIDLALALKLPLSDPDSGNLGVHPDLEHKHPAFGNGLIGYDTAHPDVVVASNGGSDLIYLPQSNAADLAAKIVAILLNEDYVSGLFVDDKLGPLPGTLPLSTINLVGSAVTPRPAIAVNFRTFDTGCALPERCEAEIADTTLQQGQGMHGSFGRGDTANFMAAYGPDFKTDFVDPAPVSNADVGMTIAQLLHLTIPAQGTLVGRPIAEALRGGTVPAYRRIDLRSDAGPGGVLTVLKMQSVGTTKYFDAAGFPGLTVGL